MKNSIKHFFLLILIVAINACCFSQTNNEIQKIVSKTNVSTLNILAAKYAQSNKEKREEILRLAKEKGLLIRRDTNGNVIELQYLDKYGFPVYYITNNANAAATTSTKKIYSGGGLGLNLSGTNMRAGLWDGGNVRVTHQEFNNTGTPRVVNHNAAVENSHSTHVAGTIAAGGVKSAAKGMAFNANVDAYDWTDDITEMTTAATGGLLVSNHSYGIIAGWYYDGINWYWYGNTAISTTEDYHFGFYDDTSADIDTLAFNAPYYLMVKAAGNDAFYAPVSQPISHKVWSGGGWVTSTAVREPNGGADGYDCISSWGNAKNVLTIGAVNDITAGYTQPSDVVIASFSSRGPTDDGRIKPDIVANGMALYSSDISNNSNNYYSSKDGTSMATPNVTGSLLLLQEHHNKLYSTYMKAATLKALVINTADESGSAEGPDYIYGWGLLNTATAANAISNKNVYSLLREETLANGATYNLTVASTGTGPLSVTIAWADPGSAPVAASLNPSNTMLVNDLDIVVTKSGTTFYPYVLDRLNPANPATKGVNSIDNVEKVYIANPTAGTYTITVNHKGTLTNGSQDFSLVATGISLGFPTINTTSVTNITKKTVDLAGNAVSGNGNSITERGFVYNTAGTPTINDSKKFVGNGIGTFSTTLSGLLPSTVYHVRAYATNSVGTSYGTQTEFTTLCEEITTYPFQENFNASTFCPTCWQTVDNQSLGNKWQFGYFIPMGDPATFPPCNNSSKYAYFDNELFSTGNQSSDLISPTFDFSGYTSIKITFNYYYRVYSSNTTAKMYYSIDDGATWCTFLQASSLSSTLDGVMHQFTKTFSTAIVNKPYVKFKWNFSYTGSGNGYYACIDDIKIEPTTVTNLMVSNSTQILAGNMAYQNVTIKRDGHLTQPADKVLTVLGNFSIESDTVGTGSFIQLGSLNVVGSTTIQKFLPRTQTTTGWTLSVPVVSATNAVFTGADNIWYFDPYVANWQSFAGGTLNQMTGYVVRFPVTKTLLFSGPFNTGDMLRDNDLMRYATPNNNYGWNYVGNPYPSPIDWSSPGITRTNVDAAVYFRKTNGQAASWVGGVSNNGGTNIIPTMQAVWVKVTIGQTSGSLKFTNDARVHGANNSLKSAPADVLSLTLSNDTTSDETVIRFKDGATSLYDSEFDAVKMFAYSSSVPQIYTSINNNDYAINALPELTSNITVPLGFKTLNAGNLTIIAANQNSFNNVSIVLEDLNDNILTDLNQQNTYSFNASPGTSTNRFVVHFNPVTTNNNDCNSTPVDSKIYSFGNAIYITNINDNNASVTIYNVLGQEVLLQKLLKCSLNKVNANLATGHYIVKVISNTKTVSQKVYLNNIF